MNTAVRQNPVSYTHLDVYKRQVNNNGMDEENLYVKACYANEGIVLKRFMPRAKGSASAIHKRTSHITFVVSERD